MCNICVILEISAALISGVLSHYYVNRQIFHIQGLTLKRQGSQMIRNHLCQALLRYITSLPLMKTTFYNNAPM